MMENRTSGEGLNEKKKRRAKLEGKMAGTSLNADKRDSVLMRISTVALLYNRPPYHRALTSNLYWSSLVLQSET